MTSCWHDCTRAPGPGPAYCLIAATVAVAGLVGCVDPRPRPATSRPFPASAHADAPVPLTPHEDRYDEALRTFAQAVFLKPSEESLASLREAEAAGDRYAGLAATFAPLLILELRDPNDIGELLLIAWGDVSGCVYMYDASLPVVYWRARKAVVNDAERDQIEYAWGHLSHGRFVVRVTLDDAGLPMFWQVQDGDELARPVFASRAAEEAAQAAFGPPLPGRRHSLEADLSQCSDVLVPRVIDDAATPMGPIIYIDPDSGRVTTVICRCMPSQADSFPETTTYELEPYPCGDWGGHDDLHRCLRLPPGL